MRLGLRPDVCHGTLGRVGQLRPRALRNSLLHHMESLEQGGHTLHPRPLHLLLPSPRPPHPHLLLADPVDGAGVPEGRQAAHIPPAQSPRCAQLGREGRGRLRVLPGLGVAPAPARWPMVRGTWQDPFCWGVCCCPSVLQVFGSVWAVTHSSSFRAIRWRSFHFKLHWKRS